MRIRLVLALVTLALVTIPFVALRAGACEVTSIDAYPDTNFVTVCALETYTYGDGTQTYANDYTAHVTSAAEADPAFNYAHVVAEKGTWTYDDGESQQKRAWSDAGAGEWVGARGIVGTGAQADIAQRDQNAIEPEGSGACSSFVGKSTCAGASGWFTVQDVASVGAGAYYTQEGSGADCHESYEVDVDAVVTFVPITTQPAPCAMQMPWVYDDLP